MNVTIKKFVIFAFGCGSFILTAAARSEQLDTALIDQLTGGKGTMNKEEGVFKVSFPRDDVAVKVDGVRLPPFMGLTSWAAFMPAEKQQAMVMGDIVLLQDEVSPAMSAALDNGLAVTALHNHFFYDEPKVYFMHIGGEGSVEALAAGVRKVLDTVKNTRSQAPEPENGFGHDPLPEKSAISAAPLAEIIGSKPAEKDGMVKFTIGRETKMPCGCAVGKEMGVNTWAAFYGSDEHAFVDGDFATFEGELQPVLKALRANNINVVAIHNHMEGESPRVIFLHYWGVGATASLAKGVRAALDEQQRHHQKHSVMKTDFESFKTGTVPSGFTTALTGGGGDVAWIIRQDPTAPAGANVLVQESTDPTNQRFPVIVYDGLTAKDVIVSVKFKPISGQVDQAAGIVWRYKDKDNYYIVRANAKENNVVLYKVENGKRTDLKVKGAGSDYGVKADVPHGQWSTLAVRSISDTFVVSINGRELFEVEDRTFQNPGKVGLWTKADSVTAFDDLEIETLEEE